MSLLLYHAIFQSLGIFTGMVIYKRGLKDSPAHVIKNKILNQFDEYFYSLILLIGAILGAHLPSVLNSSGIDSHHWIDFFTKNGITITGALCGAWLSSELYRSLVNKKYSTGDDMVIALCVGISIGRIGCFIMGLNEQTYGLPFKWGYDFGDGIKRHPTQLYDIVFLIIFAIVYHKLLKKNLTPHKGEGFNLFLACYLAWRFSIDFLKPKFGGFYTIFDMDLTFIQVLCFIFSILSLGALIIKRKRLS